MTKKDYLLIASALNGAVNPESNNKVEEEELLKYVADRLADVLAADNPLFNRDRFMAACGF